MAELPFHLKALPPEALDVLRYFGTLDSPVAFADEIIDGVGLSERTFGKVIRRLVTKGYLQMDGDQAYRLTDQGHTGVEEVGAYDETAPAAKASRAAVVEVQIQRRLVLVAPQALMADQPTDVHVGFHPAEDGQTLDEPADVVLRLSVVNGEPNRPKEASLALENDHSYSTFQITPGKFKQARIKVQVFQLGPNPDDINVAGGLYVDVNVLASHDAAAEQLVAYGADVTLTKS
jgi:predicted transcriptional regulator